MVVAAQVLVVVLALDAGTPSLDPMVESEARLEKLQQSCREAMAKATKYEPSRPEFSMRYARETSARLGPVRDELTTKLEGERASLGPARVEKWGKALLELSECMRAAEFMALRLLQAKSPNDPETLEAVQTYLLRYPSHPSAQTVKAWLPK